MNKGIRKKMERSLLNFGKKYAAYSILEKTLQNTQDMIHLYCAFCSEKVIHSFPKKRIDKQKKM